MDLREHVRGALLGTAVGDALGAAFEGQNVVDPSDLERVTSSNGVLRWTDDTHMTVAMAESLVAVGAFDGADMAAKFVAAHAAEPWRGYGAGPPRIFAAITAGAVWDQPARELFGGGGSFGNGGAMRAAPAGCFHAGDPGAAAELSRRAAAITHTHELALQGAALQAASVAWLVGQGPSTGLLEAVRRVAPAEEFQRRLAMIGELAKADPRQAVERLGNGVAAVEAVPAAMWAFLHNPGSFEGSVRGAILMGGDTDTIAAMAGAMAGAALGVGAIPEPWRRRTEAAERIVGLADALYRAAPAP